jgi:hypothetical protein
MQFGFRAYELYAQRGMTEDHAVHDWLAAEAEFLYGPSTTASELERKAGGQRLSTAGTDS